VFRNHVGKGFTGKFVRTDGKYTILENARRCSFGLQVGSSDVIGWQSVVVTPDMVGQVVAIFCAVEVKDKKGRASDEQPLFINAVRKAGGRAGIARSVEEARAIADGTVCGS
jgi:hypothetical protein